MSSPLDPYNIAITLRETAQRFPHQRGVIAPIGRDKSGRVTYSQLTFSQLDSESDALAAGLIKMGVAPGDKLVLAVRPGIEFIALTYAMFKAGGVIVLVDPGMGPKRVFGCLDQVEPDGFVGLPLVQFLRVLNGRRFSKARFNVTVGGRRFWGGKTYRELLELGRSRLLSDKKPNDSESSRWTLVERRRSDAAAIIFTSGSTGPPKGVVYEHGMFAAQVDAIRDFYGIEPGGIDVPGFPLFGLFNAAMGVTTLIPEMDAARPATVDPAKIVEAIENQGATQGFGSPAIWRRVGRYCADRGITLPSLRRVFSAGAPVPEKVLAQMTATLVTPGAKMFTPYGATEALPVASISSQEVLEETVLKTRRGAGTCVGRRFPGMDLRIIAITDEPIPSIQDARELPRGQIGEILVRGPVVTREYYRLPQATASAKISDGETFWHRMGDVGYLDESDRLWFCGRKSQRLETDQGPIYTDQVEPVFNTHPRVARTALVGVGPRPSQRPVLVVELESGTWSRELERELQDLGAGHETTRHVSTLLWHPTPLPVDVGDLGREVDTLTILHAAKNHGFE
ncbi:MAG: fatty acid CoA ligase family protein [Planctomycetota bacterium]|nr:fatty acid CoA ligase family protein [Planctomycetota bacterium]